MATVIPIIAYVKADFALFIASGLPADVKNNMPAQIIIITERAPTNSAIFLAAFVKSVPKSFAPKGFGIVTWAEAVVAKQNSAAAKNITAIFFFILFIW